MPDNKPFKLNYLREEQHLMLPTVTSIKLTQSLYDALFQYLVTDKQEALLKQFIQKLEAHIKRRDQAPFSLPISELEFLDEGLQELRLLNWMEVPVAVFQLTVDDSVTTEETEDKLSQAMDLLDRLMVLARPGQSDLIWVYPYLLVR